MQYAWDVLEGQLVHNYVCHLLCVMEDTWIMYDGNWLPDNGTSEERATGKSPTMKNCVNRLGFCIG